MCRAISTVTAFAAARRGPCAETITKRARPPISADRTTFTSTMTTRGSEIVEHLSLAQGGLLHEYARAA